MIVKICGITTLEDARAAAEAGAHMLGYNFHPRSKRYISVEACAAIQQNLKGVKTVGVFVNASKEEIERTVTACGLDFAQLSGDEPPEFCASLGVPWFKAIRPRDAAEAERDAARCANPASLPALLVDAYHPGEYGGTGIIGNWEAARRLGERVPLLLAGGLTPGNVAAAIEAVQPWGVDVASGVESAPGRKDGAKMRRFIENVKRIS
jgi:phosphoribosylanthranilate isomerase